MNGDISRDSHDSSKAYTSVRLQQGRPQLDSDWNEQADIVNREIRERMFDAAGDGAPAGAHENGYRISVNGDGSALRIGAGRYYISGIAAQNPVEHSIDAQPHFPGYRPPDPNSIDDAGVYLAYLELRERAISYLEDGSLREAALGGPDTALRMQTIAQVKLLRLDDAPEDLDAASEPTAWLNLRDRTSGGLLAEVAGGRDGPGYRLPENFLYRVEIHDGGPASAATFKWSRNNAAFAAPWLDASGAQLIIRNIARDAGSGFAPGRWVELIDEGRELRGEAGTLVRIAQVDGEIVEVDPATASGSYDPADFSEGRRLLRVWDMPGGGPGALPTLASPQALEGGLELSFGTAGPEGENQNEYRTGDYWLIPARAVTGDIEWPRDENGAPRFARPHGAPRRLSRLAFVELAGGVWRVIADARVRFPTLADIARSDNLIENKLNRFGDTMTGTLNLEADLNVQLDARMQQNLSVAQNLTVKGDFFVEGDVIARDTQHQPGDVRLGDQDEDTVTIHGRLRSEHSSGRLEIEDGAQIAGDLTVSGSIAGGAVGFQGDASISGDASIGGATDIGGDLAVTGNLALGPEAQANENAGGAFRLDVDGDVRAERFIGDGSMLTNVGNARSYYALLPEYIYPTNQPAKHGLSDDLGRRLFYTTIVNRAPMVSPALGMFLGRRRILFDDFVLAPEERGPNGERVYKIEGRDDLRLLGDVPAISNDLHGNRLILREGEGHVLEYTGYFNAVQPLYRASSEYYGLRARIDGGPEERIAATARVESPNSGRFYDAISLGPDRFESGGPPGVHTIRIAPDNDWDAYGLELIATRTDTTVVDDAPVDQTNRIDVPAQQLLLNGETTPLPAQTHDFRIDPWANGYGLRDDDSGYYDEGLDAWEDYIPLALALADHTSPQVFEPPLNIHDHVLNTATGVVYRVRFFKNLVSGEHQAVSPDRIVWDEVCTIGRTVGDIEARTDLVPNEIVYSQAQSRVYKVLATEDGSFATTRFNRRRPLNGARVVWFSDADARDEAGNARLASATAWLPPRGSALGELAGLRVRGGSQIEAFQIDGVRYVVVAHYHAAGSYNQNSPLFRWDDGRLVEIQSFPTNGAYSWKHFEIAGDHYLFVANYHNNSTHNLNSYIYKWDGAQFDPTPFQQLSTNGAIDCDFFTIDGEHYLAIANHHNGSTGHISSRIYKWDGGQFNPSVFQNISTHWARELAYFEIAGEHFLAVTNAHNGSNHNTTSYIYRWNGAHFDAGDSWSFPTYHGWGAHGFEIDGRHFVGISNYQHNGNYNTPSRIYEWNGTDFVLFQEVVVTGGNHWEDFTIDGERFLLLSGWHNGSTHFVATQIFRWTGERFAEFQSFATLSGHGAAVFEVYGETYLALPAYHNNHRSSHDNVCPIYRWNGERFLPYEIRRGRDERALGQSRPLLDAGVPDYSGSERAEFLHAWEFGNGDKNAAATVFGGFDTIRSKSNRAFTLDDGATALWGRNVRQSEFQVPAVRVEGTGDKDGSLRLAFFGTGLRVKLREDRTLYGLGGRNADGWFAVASDLSYGMHVVEFSRTHNADTATTETLIVLDGVELARDQTSLHFEAFEVMQPRRARLPQNAVVLGEYTLSADPVQQTESGPTVQCVGSRRQHATRDFLFDEIPPASGGPGTIWNYVEAPQPDDVGGIILQAGNAEKSVSYQLPFYGEGFVLRFRDDVDLADFTIRVNGDPNLLTYTTSATSGSLNPATGLFTPGRDGDLASSVAVFGLPFGEHTLEVVATTAVNSYLYISAVDIFAPMHRARHYQKHETPYLSEFIGGGTGLANESLQVFDREAFRAVPLDRLIARDRAQRPRVWSVVSKSNGYAVGNNNVWVCDRVRGGAGVKTGNVIHFGMKGVVYGSQYGGWYIKETGTYLATMLFIGNNNSSLFYLINEEYVYYAYSNYSSHHADSTPTLTLHLREGDVLHIRINYGGAHYGFHHNQFSLIKID